MQAKHILETAYPLEIVEALITSYAEVESNFRLGKWKVSELDAGHFVESARRLLEHTLFGYFTPFSEKIGSFSESTLKKYEQASGDESFRILMPRILYSIYCIRNKRGVGHIAAISPNEMDAVYILYATKWVLAELTRKAASIAPKDAEAIVKSIVEREIEAVWDDGESFIILEPKLKLAEKILITLYKRDNIVDGELQALVAYSNRTRFREQLKKLKQDLLIDYRPDKRCKISPLGIARAESILIKS